MKRNFDDEEERNISSLVQRFDEMLNNGDKQYFDIEDFEDLADYYFENNNLTKAGKVLKLGIAQHPNAAALLLKKAQLFATSDKSQKALELIAKAEKLEPDNSEIYMTKGAIYSQLKKYEMAIESYVKALQYSPEDEDHICLNIAFEYESLNKYNDALKYLKQALDFNPENDNAILESAYCFNQLHQNKKGIDFLNNFLESHPYSAMGWLSAGTIYCNSGLHEKAIEAYDYALAIDPSFNLAYYNKGECLQHIEKYDDAINNYHDLYEVTQDVISFYYMGACYEKQEKFTDAEMMFRKAIEQGADFPFIWSALAEAQHFAGTDDQALKTISRAIDADPLNPDILYLLAEIQADLLIFDDALETYKLVSNLEPLNDEIWLDYSDAYYRNNEIDNAILTINKGLEIQPENVRLSYRLVSYMIDDKRFKEAYHILENAMIKDYDLHEELIEYDPDILKDPQIVYLIELYKNK